MRKFDKLVAVEPVNMLPADEARLGAYAREVVVHRDIPQSADEAVRRIGGADAVLVSSTTRLTADILGRCPGLRYVGMCCSLYSPESANVDIRYAAGRGITVTGIRDYGDEGVVEYVVSELVRCLHGYGQEPWLGAPSEITGLKAGFVGLGASGGMIARALAGFGADVAYFARSAKPWAEAEGYRFMPLADLLGRSDVVLCCLNRGTVLLHSAVTADQLQFDYELPAQYVLGAEFAPRVHITLPDSVTAQSNDLGRLDLDSTGLEELLENSTYVMKPSFAQSLADGPGLSLGALPAALAVLAAALVIGWLWWRRQEKLRRRRQARQRLQGAGKPSPSGWDQPVNRTDNGHPVRTLPRR